MQNAFTPATNRFLAVWATALCAAFALSFVDRADTTVWWSEMASVFAVFFGLLLARNRFRFSAGAYLIVAVWLLMHATGAHYTFEKVPFDWITQFFGFERNHFDRLAHFAIGLNAYGIAEYVYRTRKVSGIATAAVFGVLGIMAMANAWELIEWAYAEIEGGTAGAAFLGSQGDVWDAQKDMLADTLGALCADAAFIVRARPRAAGF